MPIIYKHKEPKALEKDDKVSPTREAYLEKQELVMLTVEMDKAKAWELFKKLPAHVLPPLPPGYQWVKANQNYSIIKNVGSKEHEIALVLYGPDKTGYINFICLVDGVTTYSFGETRKGKTIKRGYPMSLTDYRVPNYDYSTKKYSGHVRGHLIDHQDSILDLPSISTHDPRNYIPEPPEYEWGLGFRRLKVDKLRKQAGGGAYAQMNVYLRTPLKTRNGTPVPEDVRFYAYSKGAEKSYIANEVYHVEFEEDLSRPRGVSVLEHATETFSSSLEASPIVVPYSPDLSDRAFRYQARAPVKKEQQILNGEIVSRFSDKDIAFAVCAAGDSEFQSAGRQLHAGVVRKKDAEEVSMAYVKRSLFFGEALVELDESPKVRIFLKEEVGEGKKFFEETDEDLEELEDMFRQLYS